MGGNMTEIVFKRIGGRIVPIKKAWSTVVNSDRNAEKLKGLKDITKESIDILNKRKAMFK